MPPEEKVKVDGIGGPSVEWLTNAVNAGVPDAIAAVGGKKGAAEGGWEEEGGYTLPWEDAAEPEEWLGKRPPTPSELRQYARRAGWSEDFERYTDRQLAAWLKDWDVGANKFRNPGGDLVEKPSEAGSSWSPGGGGGGGGGGPAFPGGGPGGLSDWWGTLGDAPVFEAPTWESAMEDPGYQAALKAGVGALERAQAAKGVLRTGGSLKDLLDYNQGMAAQQYGDVWKRPLGEYASQIRAVGKEVRCGRKPLDNDARWRSGEVDP